MTGSWINGSFPTSTCVMSGGFDMFLQKRGCCGNTRKFYFKALRAILNRANTEGVGSAATYPFGRGGFEVSKLEEATAKRYLPATELSKLKSTTASNPQCEYARKLFLFSYYCYGISFIDMAMLTAAHIKQMEDGDYIVYKRQKIKRQKGVKPISIKITPAIRQLIGEPASGLADRGRFPAADRNPLRLYGRAALHAHSNPLQQVPKVSAPARRGTRNRFSPDELRLPPYGSHDLAAQPLSRAR